MGDLVLTSHDTLPPFADDISVAPLVSISLAKLEAGDITESEAFFKACKELGFFYCDMLGSSLGERIVEGAERLNKLQKEWFKLPDEVKDQYTQDKIDQFFAYRFALLSSDKDENGNAKRTANYNIRKDDIIGNCERLPTHPLIIDSQPLLESYVRNCRAAIDLMLDHLNAHLELPSGTFASLHRITERSGDHIRFTQASPHPCDLQRALSGEHTDFGSITILFNWLGGLQIRLPDTNEWVYVKPIPGSAVVNLGDAMVKFSAGILRSNVHRVVPPPGEQANITRNSLVYFSRPEDTVVLKRLKGGVIDDQPEPERPEEEMTSQEWILRRSLGDLRGIYTNKGGIERREYATY